MGLVLFTGLVCWDICLIVVLLLLFVLVGLAVVGLVCLGELVVGVAGGCCVSLWFMVRSL